MTFLVETTNRPDYYLAHPPRQPKKEVADYVASCGISVPHRFDSLDDALSSGKAFVVRSEHPQDYNGASGVLDSLYITPAGIQRCIDEHGFQGRVDKEVLSKVAYPLIKIKAAEQIVARLGRISQQQFENYMGLLSSANLAMFCDFFPYTPQEFLAETSYSYWAGLKGVNRAIVADSAIRDRYHIFSNLLVPTMGGRQAELGYGYKILEGGKVIAGASSQRLPPESDDQLASLAPFYEAVRSLDRFNNNHCPIIEAQSLDGENYFLQYHRTVDFQAPQFSLDREPEEREVTPFWVRGATPPEGLSLTVGVYFDDSNPANGDEEAAVHGGSPFRVEAAIRQRKLQLIATGNHPNYLYCSPAGHQSRSELFKSQLAAALLKRDYKALAADIDYSLEHPVSYMRIRYVADGKKGYIKRLD